MVISSHREIDVRELEHSRSARETAIAHGRDKVIQVVLSAAKEDIDLQQAEDDGHIRVSASLMTLDRKEFAALAELLRAHAKGYSPTTLMSLLDALAQVFRH